MFLLAQADSEAFAPTITRFYLEELINEAARAARIIADPLNVKVVVEAEDESPMAGDEGLLRQLLLALLDNAIRHTPAGGRVTVTLTVEVDTRRIEIADTGTGISEADRPYVFDRFYRANKARTREAGGSGLGLSIAKWIAMMHKGTLTLTATSRQGTTFTLRLPQS